MNVGTLLLRFHISTKIIKNSRRFYGQGIPLEKGIHSDVEFHSRLADQWWNTEKNLLHKYNEVRIPFIKNGISTADLIIRSDLNPNNVLKGLKILDVGCGGGVLSEALARLHGDVMGIDPSAELIKVAKEHASLFQLWGGNLRYEKAEIHTIAEKHPQEFDVVIASEVIEHVFDKEKFTWNCLRCLKPRGCFIITTPNRTAWSNLFLIKFAETFKFVPTGTHDYQKFITPEELTELLLKQGCQVLIKDGFFYQFWANKFTSTMFDKFLYGILFRKL